MWTSRWVCLFQFIQGEGLHYVLENDKYKYFNAQTEWKYVGKQHLCLPEKLNLPIKEILWFYYRYFIFNRELENTYYYFQLCWIFSWLPPPLFCFMKSCLAYFTGMIYFTFHFDILIIKCGLGHSPGSANIVCFLFL